MAPEKGSHTRRLLYPALEVAASRLNTGASCRRWRLSGMVHPLRWNHLHPTVKLIDAAIERGAFLALNSSCVFTTKQHDTHSPRNGLQYWGGWCAEPSKESTWAVLPEDTHNSWRLWSCNGKDTKQKASTVNKHRLPSHCSPQPAFPPAQLYFYFCMPKQGIFFSANTEYSILT